MQYLSTYRRQCKCRPHADIMLFCLQVLPTIIFFSSFISVCYYIGIMQVVIRKIAWLMQITMKTSAVESLNAGGNIFVGLVGTQPKKVLQFRIRVLKNSFHFLVTHWLMEFARGEWECKNLYITLASWYFPTLIQSTWSCLLYTSPSPRDA